MSRYHPESWRTNASQNGLGRPHMVESAGIGRAVPNATRMNSARIADATRIASAAAAMRASVRTDKRFGETHRLGVGERLIQFREPVDTCADRPPRNRRVMGLEHSQRAYVVTHLTAPAAANLEVLAVDLLVDVDRARAGVGVVAGDDIAAAVANGV